MSLESKIDALNASIVALTEVMKNATVSLPAAPMAPVAAPVVQAPVVPAPIVQVEVPVAAPVAAAPVMPEPPSFIAPVAPVAPAAPAAPFSDSKGLVAYVMAAYTDLGAVKGAQIQNVLTSLGYSNINDVNPDHYAALVQGVEALKAS